MKRDFEKKDKKYLWHPFTQMQDWVKSDVLIVQSGDGVYLQDVEGNRYLDGVSSLWCNVHGHRIPEIDRAIQNQLGQIAHSTFLGLSNVPAIQLAEQLIRIAPKGLSRVFYSDSGSEAAEIAIKMAFQYWQHRGAPQKKRFIKLANAYHGDTIGSVSVGGIDIFHEIFGPLLFKTLQAPSPYVYRWPGASNPEQVKREALQAMERVLKEYEGEVAAIMMEPLMQGAAGMLDQPQGYITGVRDLAKKYNVLLIFDEVATGFGRTGKMFACNHEKVTPDILCLAKGITGGYLPLAATLTTEEIYRAFLGRYDEFKTFFHGHTYTANQLACSAALANLEIFKKKKVIQGLAAKIRFVSGRLKDFYKIPAVGDIRQAGLMIGIELVKDRKTKEAYDPAEQIGHQVIMRARAKGAILRPLGNVVVLMPPLGMSRQDLGKLLDITYQSIDEECSRR